MYAGMSLVQKIIPFLKSKRNLRVKWLLTIKYILFKLHLFLRNVFTFKGLSLQLNLTTLDIKMFACNFQAITKSRIPIATSSQVCKCFKSLIPVYRITVSGSLLNCWTDI